MALGKEGPVGQVEDVGHHFLRKSVTITITSANTKIVNSANSEISDSVMASSAVSGAHSAVDLCIQIFPGTARCKALKIVVTVS